MRTYLRSGTHEPMSLHAHLLAGSLGLASFYAYVPVFVFERVCATASAGTHSCVCFSVQRASKHACQGPTLTTAPPVKCPYAAKASAFDCVCDSVRAHVRRAAGTDVFVVFVGVVLGCTQFAMRVQACMYCDKPLTLGRCVHTTLPVMDWC